MKVKKKRLSDCAPSAAELILAAHDGTISNSKKLNSKRRKSKTSSLISWTPKKDVIDPSKYKRIKRRLAFLITIGNSNSRIRKKLGISQNTIDKCLIEPEFQDLLERTNDNVFGAAERDWESLFLDVTTRMRKEIKIGNSESAFKHIEMYLKAKGKLPIGTNKEGVVVNNSQLVNAQAGASVISERDEASHALKYLRMVREQITSIEDNRPLTGTES